MSLRSPLSRARGLGSAKEGVHHFWVQRVSAVALVPLALWFVFSVARFAGNDFAVVRHWVSDPSVAVTLILFLAVTLYHSALGIQVVIEDYIHRGRIVALMLSKFLHVIVAAASIFAVLKVALA
ncbi:succinate dehydrogenase, hydrophobic membrane anchor protein [Flagellatimonas centrodinii]|uniref:succinate dehydrogenase, hydrophobic membrane anchor protein n=1 Tax=Flagellatimonas centrodinii TaxID=2806210 RepID=UPI001FF0030D|nr:succinate dehydrogenase, hydrophobic membrane anchor protein [Flagellatimonas centrodinii]ULQ46586.1 succinate dehydrogenase, hydrophobic membrane anchor protein [Flagellatimonas centrodinii]